MIDLNTGEFRCDICRELLATPQCVTTIQPDGSTGQRYAMPGNFCRGRCARTAEMLWTNGFRNGKAEAQR